MTNYTIPILFMAVFVAIGIGAIAFIITFIKSHRLRLRYVVNDKKYVEDFWVMEHSDKDTGDLYWKSVFFQKKIITEKPPSSILDVGKKGKFYAELYVTGQGADGTLEGVWIYDSTDINKDTIILEEDGTKMAETFKPFSTTQRAFATRQFKKADERRSKRWDLQKIANIATASMLFIVILMGIIFAPDILDKQRQIENSRLSWLDKANDLTNKQLAITNAMGVKVENWDVVVSQSVKQDTTTNVITSNNEIQPEEE